MADFTNHIKTEKAIYPNQFKNLKRVCKFVLGLLCISIGYFLSHYLGMLLLIIPALLFNYVLGYIAGVEYCGKLIEDGAITSLKE